MIDIRKIEIDIVNGLQNEIKCSVIRANQTAPIPDYPYISYTITTPFADVKGTYGEYKNNIKRNTVKQTWSITVQSNNSTESQYIAVQANNWFLENGRIYLKDKGIIVSSVGNISNRDNLLSIDYEYRNGFDVVFALIDEIKRENEIIEFINLNKGAD